MIQFEALHEDCLLEVLDRLPLREQLKMRQVNRQLKEVVGKKMRAKIKAITLRSKSKNSNFFADCSHLGTISQDQVLVLNQKPTLRQTASDLIKQSKKDLLLSLLSTFSGVKSINFTDWDFSADLLLEVVKRCPQLECIILGKWTVKERGWELILEQIGPKIVHFAKVSSFETPSELRLLATIRSKFTNIKRVDWELKTDFLTIEMSTAFRLLPKNCWVSFKGVGFNKNNFEDFDQLDINKLNWSLFRYQVNRLSNLKCRELNFDDSPVRGVDFTNLKELDISECHVRDEEFHSCFVLSRFPRLKKFILRAYFQEDDYNALFHRMTSLKKLIIIYESVFNVESGVWLSRLPRLAIHQLKNLHIIKVKIKAYIFKNSQPANLIHLLQRLEEYVDEISSLKKLTVDMDVKYVKYHGSYEWEKTVKEDIERMKMKQNRVEICLIIRR